MKKINNRTIFEGDNLRIMLKFPNNSIDLIYLDPPFNSGTDYNVGEKGFTDTWDKDGTWEEFFNLIQSNADLARFLDLSERLHSEEMKNYLIYLSTRIIQMHRILRPTGGLALHCDDNASHYLKIVLDLVFGKENFRNDIALCYKNGSKNAKHHFPRNKDNILLYSKDHKQFRFCNTKDTPSEKTMRNIGIGFKITWNSRMNKWNETYYRDPETFTEEEKQRLEKLREKKLKERDAEIHIRMATNGKEIKYLDWWPDMIILGQSEKNINNQDHESSGWPTQKPIQIPKQIIECCTNPGDIVLDPFCGSGTTCVAAEIMDRKWVGIDISIDAVSIALRRIEDFMGVFMHTIYREKG